MNVIPETRRAH